MMRRISIDKEWLEQKYLVEQLPSRKIAELAGCSQRCVLRNMKDYNIPSRSLRESHLYNADAIKYLEDYDWMYNKYVVDKVGVEHIADELNVSVTSVCGCLDEHGISRRIGIEANLKNPNNIKLLSDKDWLYNEYITKKLSTRKIAENIGADRGTVLKYVHELGIPVIAGYHTKGPQNGNWHDGQSFKNYCFKFNEKLREEVRESFNRTCFMCDKTERDVSRHLDIHHCDFNKGQGCGHRWNLLALCGSCHTKTSRRRHRYFNELSNYWVYKYLNGYQFRFTHFTF